MVQKATRSDTQTDPIHFASPKNASYQRSDQPRGGKVIAVVELNETGMTISIGTTR